MSILIAVKHPLYLIDGYALIFRAYFALIRSPLVNAEGFNVSAVHGFARILLKIIKEYEPEYLAVSLDSRTPTFRDELYSEYKQTRDKTPEDLRKQFPVIEQLLQVLHLPTIRHNGVEADDIIASLACRCNAESRDCFIISGDKDLFQLVNDRISILRPSRHGGFDQLDAQGVFEDKGVRPDQILDYLSLIGDSSDNIPGVKGIGQKSAEKLLAEFETLEGIYEHLDTIPSASWRKKLEDGKDLAELSKTLITLKDDVALNFAIEDLNLESLNGARAADFLETYHMNTLAADLRKIQGSTPGKAFPFYGMDDIDVPEVDPGGAGLADPLSPLDLGTHGAPARGGESSDKTDSSAALLSELTNVQQDYELVKTADELRKWMALCRDAAVYAFDTETDSLDPLQAKLVGFSLSHAPGRGCYVPFHSPENSPAPENAENSPENSPENSREHLGEEEGLSLIAELLEDETVKLVGQNIKFDYKIMARRGIFMAKPWFDTLIAGWLLNTTQNAYSMDALADKYLSYQPQKLIPLYEEIIGRKISKASGEPIDFSRIPLSKALFYAAEDADITLRLYRIFEKKLGEMSISSEKTLLNMFFELEMPLIPILAAMELKGICLNARAMEEYSRELAQKLLGIEKDIYELCGHEFNIASTKQLQVVLFEERKLKTGKKTKTGYSTDTSVLEELAAEDPVPALVLRHRGLSKLKSTYVDTLPTLINPRTGRIHSRFQQNGTATGRISSHDPNLQNIPIRDEEGRRIRTAFVPAEGCRFISADYSQIELVVLAHLSSDRELIDAFQKGIDVHALTGSLIFQVPPSEVDALQRRIAKTINFGVMYGMSAFRLAREIGISRNEAQQFIDAYFETYSGIRGFVERSIKKAETYGYVETMLGRRRFIPAIHSSNRHEKMGGERIAVNTPIQGSAADIVKRAMIRVDAALRAGNFTASLLLQVHDELIFEVPEGEVEDVKVLLADIMPRALLLDVPLRVNIETGYSWGDMH
ncbi:MAG: DNA polymerase I [Salinispira sp.]